MKQLRRQIEVLQNGNYIPVEMKDLLIGDQFRMFEPDGTPVVDTNDNKSTEWIVTQMPIFIDGAYTNEPGGWGVTCESVKENTND